MLTTSKGSAGAQKSGEPEKVISISGLLQPGKWTNLCVDMNSLSAHMFPNAKEKQQPERLTNSRSMARSRGESMNGDSRGGMKRSNGQSNGANAQLFGTSQQHHGQTNKATRDNGPPPNIASPYGNSVNNSNQNTTTNSKRAPNFKSIESIEL